MSEAELKPLLKKYILSLLRIQEVKIKGVGLFKSDEETLTELYMIEKSINYIENI